MGHFSKNIATEDIKPAKVSLSGVSNFLQFKAIQDTSLSNQTVSKKLVFDNNPKFDKYSILEVELTFTEETDVSLKHSVKGTYKEDEVDDKTFFLPIEDKAGIMENVRACLMKDTFFRNNFNITLPYAWDEDYEQITNADYLLIESLGTGKQFNFKFETKITLILTENLKKLFATADPDERAKLMKIPEADTDYVKEHAKDYVKEVNDKGTDRSENSDLIDQGVGNKDIEVEVYTNLGVFLGMPDHPSQINHPGKLVTTLSKSYAGQPLWFDINSLLGTNKVYSNQFLKSGTTDAEGKNTTWVDAGTMDSVRLIARTNDKVRRETFYYSEVLYAVTGYARTLDRVDMNNYTFRHQLNYVKPISPLSHQPVLPHVNGQSQYFNFIFSDSTRGSQNEEDAYQLGIFYEFYTQSGVLIDSQRSLMQDKSLFAEVNTVKLNLDEMIEAVESKTSKTVGIVKAYLADNQNVASRPLEFRIMPACLTRIHDFAFLNALGGWSSFNFSGERTTTVKSDAIKYYKNVRPDYTPSGEIEAVLDREIDEQFTVKTAPITASVANWLKELSASIAVYELSSKRYVVVDSFDIKHTTKDDLFVLELKYHYSDTFNGVIK